MAITHAYKNSMQLQASRYLILLFFAQETTKQLAYTVMAANVYIALTVLRNNSNCSE